MDSTTTVIILAFSFCLLTNIGSLISRKLTLVPSSKEDNETVFRIILLVLLTLWSFFVFIPLSDLLDVLFLREANQVVWVLPVLLLNSILFMGSIYQEVVLLKFSEMKRKLAQCIYDLQVAKAILIAPLIEELFYRVLFTYILQGPTSSFGAGESISQDTREGYQNEERNDGLSFGSLVLISAGAFSVSHGHSIVARLFGLNDLPALTSILVTLFQMSFTFVFGLYVEAIYLRTGSWLAAVALHSMCNILGIPNVKTGKEDPGTVRLIWLMYIGGVFAFFLVLFGFFF